MKKSQFFRDWAIVWILLMLTPIMVISIKGHPAVVFAWMAYILAPQLAVGGVWSYFALCLGIIAFHISVSFGVVLVGAWIRNNRTRKGGLKGKMSQYLV